MLVCYGNTSLAATIGMLGLNIPYFNPNVQEILMRVLGRIPEVVDT